MKKFIAKHETVMPRVAYTEDDRNVYDARGDKCQTDEAVEKHLMYSCCDSREAALPKFFTRCIQTS